MNETSETMVPAAVLGKLVKGLLARISTSELVREIGEDEFKKLETEQRDFTHQEAWNIMRVVLKHGFFDLPPAHGLPSTSYDVNAAFNMLGRPIGFDQDAPLLPLINKPTKIAGYPVDFPFGLPASVLAANANWIEFYARRGVDILTYKTVRAQYRKVHSWPNWVFVENPYELAAPSEEAPTIVTGRTSYFPADRSTISMANSFGVPSLDPTWWKDDVRRARQVVREGHQVLIVSVIASKSENEEVLTADFVETALMAKDAGADIIEANYSCPNTPDDPGTGEVYKSPGVSSRISKALKEALGKTPLFVKIGYLPDALLREFVVQNVGFVDGIVAINTISAKVDTPDAEQVFPGEKRHTAGISGWAIRARAHEVARNLVALRKELNKPFTIFGLGGVLTRQDYEDFLAIGVDAVESCTGAFLNPHLGLEIRLDVEAAKHRPSRIAFEFKAAGKFFEDVLLHPSRNSRVRVDRKARRVSIE